MAFFRKAGNILGRTVSNHINQEISSSKPSIFQVIRYMSSSKLFIGGLSYSTDDASLSEAFNKYGEVAEARVIVDRETGRSRGFGFVTYSSVEEASAAIQALDQQVYYLNFTVGGLGWIMQMIGLVVLEVEASEVATLVVVWRRGFGGAMVVVVITIAITYGGGGYGAVQISTLGVNSYGSGSGPEGSSNYASNTGYDSGNLSYGGESQNFGIAGSGDNFSSTAASSGHDGFGDKFGSNQTNNEVHGIEGFGRDDSVEGNYRDEMTTMPIEGVDESSGTIDRVVQ
ncbi:Glycine-rich RNA-binding protein 3, mitochondrial [Sesamum angolense]|uniref:Glycine-rich RNA-binding protein 3, mitochondrial n=1 Tax=Sesamum angolense TaxID=2727404 RepID=A0AAE2BS48_9LAMI|nr:Glycine-rich RNA-binding protein 3, mitochondrial [Sesamum angolense]